MADCRETIVQLYAYLDQMLDESLREEIDIHLGECADCQGRVEFEFTLKARIKDRAIDEPLPPELERRLRECLDLDFD